MKLLFPLDYLGLRSSSGARVIRRDIWGWLLFSSALSVPFIVFDKANYFHKDGLLDKVGSFSSVLLGFYVAALIAVATLSSSFADLDKTIQVGIIRKPPKGAVLGEKLSRREYICYMFGYMALVSLMLALGSMLITALAPLLTPFSVTFKAFDHYSTWSHRWLRGAAIVAISIPLGSLAVTTLRGLYYLVERLYEQEPEVDQARTVNSPEENLGA
ncbi:hypothetical protein U1701_04270 [Sphingomonas sp. PB2P19]|uniref:hypothetical protein n=1 Tax=Sphingomonas rhamnosi TaxID=3096156 RepID=UPI002FC990B0